MGSGSLRNTSPSNISVSTAPLTGGEFGDGLRHERRALSNTEADDESLETGVHEQDSGHGGDDGGSRLLLREGA